MEQEKNNAGGVTERGVLIMDNPTPFYYHTDTEGHTSISYIRNIAMEEDLFTMYRKVGFFNALFIIITHSKDDVVLSQTLRLIANAFSHSIPKGRITLKSQLHIALGLAMANQEFAYSLVHTITLGYGPCVTKMNIMMSAFIQEIKVSFNKMKDGLNSDTPKFLSQIRENMWCEREQSAFSKKIGLFLKLASEIKKIEVNDDCSLSDRINLHKGLLLDLSNVIKETGYTNHTEAGPSRDRGSTAAGDNLREQTLPPHNGVCVTNSRRFRDAMALDGLILPKNFILGRASADGSCFFDSFRQGLQRLGIEETVENIRRICKQFAENPLDWFVTAVANSHNLDGGVRRETPQGYVDAIERSDRWGDPDVEGRILCGHFGVTLYLIEKQSADGQNVYTYQMIEGNGCKCISVVDFQRENALYIINLGHGHFEPVTDEAENNAVNSDLNIIDTKKIFNVHSNTSSLSPSYETRKKTNKPINLSQGSTVQCSDGFDKRRVIDTFNKFKDAISKGDVNRLSNLINVLYRTADKASSMTFYKDNENTIRDTHLITLACIYNQPSVLEFLLHKSNILYYLPNEGPAVEKAYKQAVCATMESFNIKMLEILYDYWSGKGHWRACAARLSDTDIHKLRWLQRLLIDSKAICKAHLKSNEQMHVDVQCLIWFSSFQIRLYVELSELKGTNDAGTDKRIYEVEATRDMLLTAFRVYEEYCNKNIRLPKHLKKDKLEPLLDEDSLNVDHLCYAMYELYYRKLDYNIALLIINNLHFLKLRLMMPNHSYQEIECTLYYFLYRYNEDWRLYLSGSDKHNIRDSTSKSTKRIQNPSVKHEPLIYFEWLRFRKSLNKFIDALKNISVEQKLRSNALPTHEFHSLLLLPYMRDDYTLKKILHYIDQMPDVNVEQDKENHLNQKQNISYLLVIERIIQVTGEFLKSTKDTCHLSPTVMTLLREEIPRNTYKNLQKLRDNLSHMKDGQLIRRIDLETNRSEIFENALKDLKQIRKAISDVINVYKPMSEIFLLVLGKPLLQEKFAQLQHTTNGEALSKHKAGCPNIKEDPGTFQCYKELLSLHKSLMRLSKKRVKFETDLYVVLIKKIPQYTNVILQTINVIERQNQTWESIVKDLNHDVKDYPNKNCIENIKKELKILNKTDKLKELAQLKDWANDDDWLRVKELFRIIIVTCGFFFDHYFGNRWTIFDLFYDKITSSPPDKNVIGDVRTVTEILREISQKHHEFYEMTCIVETDAHDYKHTDALAEALLEKRFITQKEKEYLEKNTVDICDCPDDKQCKHKRTCSKLLEKIHKDIALEGKEHKITMELKMNEKCRRIINNIVLGGGKRDRSVLECLVSRTQHLSTLLEGSMDKDELVLKYLQDKTFRLGLEMIASDIMNIYKEDGWLKELSNTRYTELLTEYPLRNILDHGHPLIDVGSASFDAKDFPNALVSFALDVVQDETYIGHLYKLYEDDVDRNDVINDSPALSKNQQELVTEFKRCSNWKNYVKLLPDKNQSTPPKQQTRPKKNKN